MTAFFHWIQTHVTLYSATPFSRTKTAEMHRTPVWLGLDVQSEYDRAILGRSGDPCSRRTRALAIQMSSIMQSPEQPPETYQDTLFGATFHPYLPRLQTTRGNSDLQISASQYGLARGDHAATVQPG